MRYFTNEILKTMSNLPLSNLTQILVYKFTKFISNFKIKSPTAPANFTEYAATQTAKFKPTRQNLLAALLNFNRNKTKSQIL